MRYSLKGSRIKLITRHILLAGALLLGLGTSGCGMAEDRAAAAQLEQAVSQPAPVEQQGTPNKEQGEQERMSIPQEPETQACHGTCCNALCNDGHRDRRRLPCGTCTNWAQGVCQEHGGLYFAWWNTGC